MSKERLFMINFILPDQENTRHINFNLFKLKESCPELFNPKYKISSVYGVLINSYMDGGRNIMVQSPPEMAELIIQDYQHFNVNYSHVLSAYYDNFYKDDVTLNNILKIADKNKNNVIISDLRLLEHIHNFYPNITTIASAVQLLDLDTSLSYLMNDTFDYVVLQTKYNNQLESIASSFKDRIVILPNDCCPSDCPLKRPCYERTFALNRSGDFTHIKWGEWTKTNSIPCNNQKKLLDFKNAKDMYEQTIKVPSNYAGAIPIELAIENGYNNIKLEGRRKSPEELCYLYASIFSANKDLIPRIMYDLLVGMPPKFL